ncbi:MAG: SNF2-related protein [Bryobacteraceae bacterium]|nr:SNF2-related protein [Bryobacteraceae bacterium]
MGNWVSGVLAQFFSRDVRERGQALYASGAVQIAKGTAAEVTGFVKGTREYFVSIEVNKGVVEVYCECPHFEGGETCKHLWATVLAADNQRHLGQALAALKLRIEMINAIDEAMEEPDDDDDDVEEEDEVDEEDEELQDEPYTLPPPRDTRYASYAPPPANVPNWKHRLAKVGEAQAQWSRGTPAWPAGREILYMLREGPSDTRYLLLALVTREPMKKGGFSRPKRLEISRQGMLRLPDEADREILALLVGPPGMYSTDYDERHGHIQDTMRLSGLKAELVMPRICATGRCYFEPRAQGEWIPLSWDDGPPYRFELELSDAKPKWTLSGRFSREGNHLPLEAARAVSLGGLLIAGNQVARLDHGDGFEVLLQLRANGAIEANRSEIDELLGEMFRTPGLPPVKLPESLAIEQSQAAPQPRLEVTRLHPWDSHRLKGTLSFDYAGARVEAATPGPVVYDREAKRLVHRDTALESAAQALLLENGFRIERTRYPPFTDSLVLPSARLPGLVRALVKENWRIEAEGKVFRRPGGYALHVSSGIDWFELHGTVEFEGATATLPELLRALKRGENMVQLSDGSYGMLPEEWLHDIGSLVQMGALEKDHVRFRKNQAGLLDVLLADRGEVDWDKGFERAREELKRFAGIEPAPQPAGFQGSLRGYQLDGLGWLHFLRQFGFGGCLADDMGVGKTPQVLALLETRREQRQQLGPSLVVVPKSLIFNWKQEAARFTPELRVLDHTGLGRSNRDFDNYDVILTTYGTLRRDVVEFQKITFDYVILDEAQAIKNAATESAKAARLLNANHRLALSGTPVENHLGELWSLFEFLNPGMLGASAVLKTAGPMRDADEGMRRMLAKSLRPFILRRTKQQVASELPPKVEQTLFCELEPAQRKLYTELRDHYRGSLLGRIDKHGMARSKMFVLEALLRLRQAACHPGLVDPKHEAGPSAKLDMLIPQLEEVLEEGHKALVFSQFVSFLDILRRRLDKDGVVYEYLDGKTRNRQERVERFQSDPDCKLFLISLKAGGVGLNLTAADYVFLLDPWWNPAVEAQAIDRTHRIGQDRHVFAYRLIARDTVEEKVLALQSTKRDLADAIINEDNSLIRGLGREELELLLS